MSEQPRKGRGLLAVEITLKAVADSFMQHHTRPAVAENDVVSASRGRDGFKIDERLTQRFIGHMLPAFGGDEVAKALASAKRMRARFLTIAIACNDGNAEPNHWTYIANEMPVSAKNLNMLP